MSNTKGKGRRKSFSKQLTETLLRRLEAGKAIPAEVDALVRLAQSEPVSEVRFKRLEKELESIRNDITFVKSLVNVKTVRS